MKLTDVKDRPMLIAVDFDRTLTKGSTSFPEIGEDAGGVEWLTLVADHPRIELILWTMREDEALRAALDWCADRGLCFDAVNGHEQNWATKEGGTPSRKTFFDLLIDDATLGVPIVPAETRQLFEQGSTSSQELRISESYVDWSEAGPMMMDAIMYWLREHPVT